ncbi:MAG: hypothetical protein EOP06_26845 [Proteobacteria bacterium]|nr:MAG: hypothetical protein EOP06_26845 [Pseudomonadota bacterium]
MIFGIAAHGLLVNYLRHGKNDRGTVFCANAAFFFLIIAAIAFLIFAKLSMTTDSDYASAITAVEKATADMPAISGNKDSKWNIQSLVWQETEKIWEIIVIERNLSLRFRVSISGVSGNTIKAEKF